MLRKQSHITRIEPVDHFWVAMTGKMVRLIASRKYTVGRQEECDIRVNDTLTSRLHATLTWIASAGWTITDNSSKRGTFVNGARIQVPTTLQDHDRIQVGGWEFSYRQAPNGTEPQVTNCKVSEMPTFEAGSHESMEPDLSGRLASTPVSMLLAYMHETTSSGTIVFDRHESSRYIVIHDGNATYAIYNEWEGVDALSKAAEHAAQFVFFRHRVDPSHKGYNVHGDFTEIHEKLTGIEPTR